jgi:tripartite-type tricarboxylate transporter receptor subunit TctC
MSIAARILVFIMSLLDCAAFAQSTQAPITWAAAMAAGGGTDVVARELAARLSERLGQVIVVENLAGAAGGVAALKVKSAQPNGLTYLFATNSLLTKQVMSLRPEFDMVRDFMAVAPLVEGPYGIFVNPSVPAQTLRSFIAYAKANPGKLNYASTGVGSSTHLAAEELNMRGGVKITHISYKGGAPAVLDLVADRVQMSILGITANYQQMVDAGKLRLLAVTSRQRLSTMPTIPTAEESGLPGYHPTFWLGLFAPAGTSTAILNRINADLRSILGNPEIRQRYAAQGYTILTMTPDETQKKVGDEIADLSKIVDAAGIERQ